MKNKILAYVKDKDNLTIWMNNLLVVYAFLLPISQTIKATIFTFIVLLFIVRGDVLKHIKESLSNSVVRAFLYFFIIYVVGMLWTEDVVTGLYDIKSIKYGLYLIVFYSVVDGRYINRVITAFILGMLVSELTSYGMLLGIMPWALDIGAIHFYTAPSQIDPSPFLNHIHYGVALSFAVVLIAQQIYVSNKAIWLKILMSIFVFTASANIFVTGGRTGYITFILLILTLTIFYLKRWAAVGIAFLVLVLGIAYNSSPVVKLKVKQTEHSLVKLLSDNPNFNTSIGTRAGLFYYGFEAVKNDTILGVGTGDSMNEIYKVTPKKWKHIHSQPHEHNQFLSTFVKLGLVGLLLFLNIYYQIFTYKQEDKELRFIMIFSTLAIAFGILTTQFNLRFFMPLWVVMLAITLISRERRTINMDLNNKKVIFQTLTAGALFSFASLFHQLL